MLSQDPATHQGTILVLTGGKTQLSVTNTEDGASLDPR